VTAGLLLTGGSSERMGADKAVLVVEGERLADRTARVLGAVCLPVLEVGPGYTGLERTAEEPAGSGPLAAVAAGGRALRDRGHDGPALVLAVDMPFVSETFLRFLSEYPGRECVVPFVRGRSQPLCARYSAEALRRAGDLVGSGERSMRALLASVPVQHTGPRQWAGVADERVLADVDTPDDLARLGLGEGVEQ
jgi:molybdenum cofactor guanylyltransferase